MRLPDAQVATKLHALVLRQVSIEGALSLLRLASLGGRPVKPLKSSVWVIFDGKLSRRMKRSLDAPRDCVELPDPKSWTVQTFHKSRPSIEVLP